MKHPAYLRVHAKRRAAQRYGIMLNRAQLNELVKQIWRGEATLVHKVSVNRSIWIVRLPDSRPARIVFDKKRRSIVTFLPDSPSVESA